MYTRVVQHLDWDLFYLGDHLAAQIEEWSAELQVEQPPVEECPTVPVLPTEKVEEGPRSLPDGLPE